MHVSKYKSSGYFSNFSNSLRNLGGGAFNSLPPDTLWLDRFPFHSRLPNLAHPVPVLGSGKRSQDWKTPSHIHRVIAWYGRQMCLIYLLELPTGPPENRDRNPQLASSGTKYFFLLIYPKSDQASQVASWWQVLTEINSTSPFSLRTAGQPLHFILLLILMLCAQVQDIALSAFRSYLVWLNQPFSCLSIWLQLVTLALWPLYHPPVRRCIWSTFSQSLRKLFTLKMTSTWLPPFTRDTGDLRFSIHSLSHHYGGLSLSKAQRQGRRL